MRRAKCTVGIYDVLSPYECCLEQLSMSLLAEIAITLLCCADPSPRIGS